MPTYTCEVCGYSEAKKKPCGGNSPQGNADWVPIWKAAPEYGPYTFVVRWACWNHAQVVPDDRLKPPTLF